MSKTDKRFPLLLDDSTKDNLEYLFGIQDESRGQIIRDLINGRVEALHGDYRGEVFQNNASTAETMGATPINLSGDEECC